MSDLIVVLSVLLITIVISHLFLIIPEYRNSKKWIKSDYVWLTFMAIGLITAVTPGRKFIAKRDLPIIEGQIIGQYESALSNARNWDNHLNNVVQYHQWQYNEDDSAKFIAVGKWYKAFHDTLELGYDSFSWRIYVKPIITVDKYFPAEFQRFQKRALTSLSKADSLTLEAAKRKKKLKDSEFELALMLFSPIFLAIGLGIRITKVTVIICENRKNKCKLLRMLDWVRREARTILRRA